MRVKHGHYKYKTPFRAHSLLSDVPLHDVWAILLHARGPKRNIQDVRRVLASLRTEHPDPLVDFFLRARQRLGRIFEWDDENHGTPDSSYVHRLTPDDRSSSLEPPGTIDPASDFRVLYVFENEAAFEVINGTGQSFYVIAMEPVAEGYILYAAVYVKQTSLLTPFYTVVADPFLRYIIYPTIIHNLESLWAGLYARTRQHAPPPPPPLPPPRSLRGRF